MARELKVEMAVKFPDGTIRDWNDLSEEEIAYCRERWRENLSRNMSLYYSEHPDEYEKLPNRSA